MALGSVNLLLLSALDTRVEEDLCFPAHMLGSCAVLRELLLVGGLLQVAGPEALEASGVSILAA